MDLWSFNWCCCVFHQRHGWLRKNQFVVVVVVLFFWQTNTLTTLFLCIEFLSYVNDKQQKRRPKPWEVVNLSPNKPPKIVKLPEKSTNNEKNFRKKWNLYCLVNHFFLWDICFFFWKESVSDFFIRVIEELKIKFMNYSLCCFQNNLVSSFFSNRSSRGWEEYCFQTSLLSPLWEVDNWRTCLVQESHLSEHHKWNERVVEHNGRVPTLLWSKKQSNLSTTQTLLSAVLLIFTWC